MAYRSWILDKGGHEKFILISKIYNLQVNQINF